MNRACQNCRFYNAKVTTGRSSYSPDAGECRINPPGVFAFEHAESGDAAFRMWPIVWEHDWCGCFTEIEVST